MRWLAIEAGDAATWGSTVVTFGMACYAIAQGISQRRDLRRQNELQAEASQLQRRQIETAERRTLIMEDLLHRLNTAAWPAAPAPAAPAPASAWQQPPPAQAPEPSHQGARPQPPPPPTADEGPAEAAWDEEVDVPEDVAASDAEPQERTAPSGPPGEYGASNPPGGYGFPPPPPAQQQPPPGAVPRGGTPVGAPWSGPVGPRTDGPSVPAQPPPHAPQSPYPAPAPSPVPTGPWRVERVGRHTFALRNTGPRTLTGVRVGRANLPSSARGVPEDAVVRPGETTEFLMAAERGQPLPGTLAVSWDEQTGEVHVPVPFG